MQKTEEEEDVVLDTSRIPNFQIITTLCYMKEQRDKLLYLLTKNAATDLKTQEKIESKLQQVNQVIWALNKRDEDEEEKS